MVEVLPGEQPVILDRELFDAVQAKLTAGASDQGRRPARSKRRLDKFAYPRHIELDD